MNMDRGVDDAENYRNLLWGLSLLKSKLTAQLEQGVKPWMQIWEAPPGTYAVQA